MCGAQATTKSITLLPAIDDNTVLVRVTNGCSDTASASMHIFPVKPVTACCDTTIQLGGNAVIKAKDSSASYVWSPSGNIACDTCFVTTASPQLSTIYTVTATDKNGCTSYDTVTIHIEKCGTAWIPNAFTPNGDHVNDYFEPKGVCIYKYTMYIFDRWGSLIYQTTDSKAWDGTIDGRKVQEDTYVYQLVITNTDLVQRTFVGNVTVIR